MDRWSMAIQPEWLKITLEKSTQSKDQQKVEAATNLLQWLDGELELNNYEISFMLFVLGHPYVINWG